MVRLWLVCLTLGSLTACSSTPLQLPTCEIPGPSPEVQSPLVLPDRPAPVGFTDDTVTFDIEGMESLTRYRIASDTNATIAEQNALALRARNEEVEALIECSRYSRMWMEIREDMLDAERRDHQIDNFFHRGLIALGVLVSL
jgi:hypothetical protein